MNRVGHTIWRTANRASVWIYRTSKGRIAAKAKGVHRYSSSP